MKTQREWLDYIQKLSGENPDFEIRFLVGGDGIEEDHWSCHVIFNVEISPWWRRDERIETDKFEILELMMESLFDEGLDDEDIEVQADEWYDRDVEQAICIYTQSG